MTTPHIGICKHCGKQTQYKYKSWVKDYCSHTCSNTTKWEARERAETKHYKCVKCEKPFSRLAYIVSHRESVGKPIKYCSVECGHQDRVNENAFKELQCSKCGVGFKKRARFIGAKNYCSRECSSLAQRKDGSVWSAHNHDGNARREYMRAYTHANRKRKNELSRQWAKQNIEYRRFIQSVRRAAGSLTFDQWQSVITDSGGKCKVCNEAGKLQVDHIKPVARGGKTEIGNLQMLCRFCNISKGAKPFTDWLPQRLKELDIMEIKS